MSFTCPQCGRTSHNPNDEREGWCSACGGVTRDPHEPWTPWSIWQDVDLPDEAYERMVQGGVWRVQEPPSRSVSVVPRNPNAGTIDRSYRIAVYRIGRALGFGKATIIGQWQGDKEWVEVGYIEEGG